MKKCFDKYQPALSQISLQPAPAQPFLRCASQQQRTGHTQDGDLDCIKQCPSSRVPRSRSHHSHAYQSKLYVAVAHMHLTYTLCMSQPHLCSWAAADFAAPNHGKRGSKSQKLFHEVQLPCHPRTPATARSRPSRTNTFTTADG